MKQVKQPSKILWVDTETTGLDPNRNDIWQIAMLVEINGDIVERAEWKLRPRADAIDPDALALRDDIDAQYLATLPEPRSIFPQIKQFLAKYINKFDKDDKFIIAGYYVRFDVDHLRALWQKCGDKYFGSWFFNAQLDISCIVALLCLYGMRFKNFKLSTICESFAIELDAHDALSDIQATRQLFQSIKGVIR